MLGQWALDRLSALGSFVLLFFSLLSRMGPILRRGRLIAAQTHFLGNHSLAIILVSGLDLAHQRKPMVAVYWVGWFRALASRFILTMPDRLLPNIVAGRRIVPEFVPCAGGTGSVVRALGQLLDDPAARARTARDLDAVARRFEGHDPGREAAEVVLGFLDS